MLNMIGICLGFFAPPSNNRLAGCLAREIEQHHFHGGFREMIFQRGGIHFLGDGFIIARIAALEQWREIIPDERLRAALHFAAPQRNHRRFAPTDQTFIRVNRHHHVT